MRDRMEILARGMLRPINPYLASLLGIMTFAWGLWILSPWWHAFSRAPVYSKASDLAPEWAWGAWAAFSGLALFTSVWSGRSRWLSNASTFTSWHWFTIAGMMWWGDWQSTAPLVYTFIGLYAAFIHLNARVNLVRQGIERF